MSGVIHSKATVAQLLQNAVNEVMLGDVLALAVAVNKHILTQKIKFPALEHCAQLLYAQLPAASQLPFTNQLINPKTMGGWVIAGKMLQLRLGGAWEESLQKAVEYIIEGNEWYVCDIIGERVMGHGLLKYPEKMVPLLPQLAAHNDKWIVRSIGVAAHYATKKGMQPQHAAEVFKLLLSLANTTDFHTKKGIGWGAKTIAKFHPHIIETYKTAVFDNPAVKRWFVTKVNIGLGRNKISNSKFQI